MSKSKIEWTDAVWNPITGCTKVSAGCAHCYAEREWKRLAANLKTSYYGRNFNDVRCHPERLDQPLRWKKPRRIFVNSMSDLFHEDIDEGFLCRVFDEMLAADQHTYLILTKRPKKMLDFAKRCLHGDWKNIWLGVSVENQATADERIPLLLQTPAAVRFISAEPLLGPISLTELHYEKVTAIDSLNGLHGFPKPHAEGPKLNWIICGGESGPNARPMHPDWMRKLRDQCQEAKVPFFFKSWGEWMPNGPVTSELRIARPGGYIFDKDAMRDKGDIILSRVGKKQAGRNLDGREWEEMPENHRGTT